MKKIIMFLLSFLITSQIFGTTYDSIPSDTISTDSIPNNDTIPMSDTIPIDTIIIDTIPIDTDFVIISNNIIDDSKIWYNIAGSIVSYINVECCFNTSIIKLSGSKIIDSKTYTKVLQSTDQNQTKWDVIAYIRESSDKIYMRTDLSSEGLIYDFSVQKGDTVLVFNYSQPTDTLEMIVDSIDEYEIANQKKKRIILCDSSNIIVDYWIEGIGSMWGLINSGYKLAFDNGIWHKLLCLEIDQEIAYHNTKYKSCYVSGLTGEDFVLAYSNSSPKINIYPNPVSQNSTLKIEGDIKNYTLQIINVIGEEVYNKSLTNNQIALSNNMFKKGLYIYFVSLNKKIINTGKFIVHE